jgi:hypothetical protein
VIRRLLDEIDDAGDRIGAVLRGRTILQDFDVIDRIWQDEADVRRGAAAVGAVPWRRLPLTRISVWFGLRPRSLSWRLCAWRSLPNDCAWIDGRFCARLWIRSGEPVRFNASLPRIWIGAGLSAARMPVVRVPVTMMSAPPLSATCGSAGAGAGAAGSAGVAAGAAGSAAANTGAAHVLAQASANKDIECRNIDFCPPGESVSVRRPFPLFWSRCLLVAYRRRSES